MPLRSPLADRLGLRYPIVQAPIGSASTGLLAARVSRAGALGTLAASWRTPAEIVGEIGRFREAGGTALAVNLVLEWDQTERVRVALDQGVRLISLVWGDPEPLVPLVHRDGALVLHTVGSVAEARRAAAAGVDVVVAQGWEAGGHVRGTTASSVLVPAVVDAVAPTPVIAAGGIADGRGIVAALALGAGAAMLGTRFLASPEADVHPVYRDRILAADDTATRYTLAFDGGWPDAPHRVLENDTVRKWEAWRAGRRGPRPGEGEVLARRVNGDPIERYDDVIPTRGTTGDVAELALYAGQSVALVTEAAGAATVVERLVAEAEAALDRLAALGAGR